MPTALFESEPWRYDALIDWDRRLAREETFFRWLLAQLAGDTHAPAAPESIAVPPRALRVLDAACGTGQHARRFAAWGCEVEGADRSLAMVAYCRSAHGASERLRWVQRPFDNPPEQAGTFDLALCIGNSLALAESEEEVRRALRALTAAVRPGGLAMVQLLNLWALTEGPPVWQKAVHAERAGEPTLLIKGVQREGAAAWVHLLEVRTAGPSPRVAGESTRLLNLRLDRLEQVILEAGGLLPRAYGSYERTPYDEAHSQDLIVTWRRG